MYFDDQSIDIVLASKIDSYLIIAITELNNPEKYKVPRNHYVCIIEFKFYGVV